MLGTENFGTANAHTTIQHRLDEGLANTLQHRFMPEYNNILSEDTRFGGTNSNADTPFFREIMMVRHFPLFVQQDC